MRLTQTEQSELHHTSVAPLSELEQALLVALDDLLVSTTVLKDRAYLIARKTNPALAKAALAKGQPLAPILAACGELERQGLAERVEVARHPRWRRAGTGVSTV